MIPALYISDYLLTYHCINIWEYGFPLDRILPYKDGIRNSTLIQENTGHWKPVLRMFYVVYIQQLNIFQVMCIKESATF